MDCSWDISMIGLPGSTPRSVDTGPSKSGSNGLRSIHLIDYQEIRKNSWGLELINLSGQICMLWSQQAGTPLKAGALASVLISKDRRGCHLVLEA